jgi:hypothetical protein
MWPTRNAIFAGSGRSSVINNINNPQSTDT